MCCWLDGAGGWEPRRRRLAERKVSLCELEVDIVFLVIAKMSGRFRGAVRSQKT